MAKKKENDVVSENQEPEVLTTEVSTDPVEPVAVVKAEETPNVTLAKTVVRGNKTFAI